MPTLPEILIISYRRVDLLALCLESIDRHLPAATVRVWDNSSDASEQVRAYADTRPDVDWHFAPTNLGFAAAVNQLMALVTSDVALLLNPDALLQSDLAASRQAALEPGVAAVAPWVSQSGQRPWDNAHREPDLVRQLVSYLGWDDRVRRAPALSMMYEQQPTQVDGYLTGAALLISMTAWREVGGFDERYFLYAEEADWCRRAREAGFRLLSVAEPGISHTAGGTVADAQTQSSRSRELLDENRARYLRDHHGDLAGRAFVAATRVINHVQPSKRRARARTISRTEPDFIITTPTLDVGGAERQRVQLANALSAQGFHVVMRVLQHTGSMAANLSPDVEVVIAPYRDVARRPSARTLLVTGTTRIECAFGLMWRTLNAPHGRWVAANHTSVVPGEATFDRFATWALRRSDGIIYLSAVHRKEHQTVVDIDHGRFWIIPNGIPVGDTASGRRTASDGPTRFVAATRLEEFKQVDHLIAAFGSEMDDLDWTLDIWGDGPHRHTLAELVPDRYADRIRLRGWCSDIDAAFAEADVYCLTSRREAQPMVILEAMDAGLCVASTAISAIPEMLAEGAGVLVAEQNPQAWRDVARRLILDPMEREEIAAEGQRRMRSRYSVAQMAQGYVDLRREVLGKDV